MLRAASAAPRPYPVASPRLRFLTCTLGIIRPSPEFTESIKQHSKYSISVSYNHDDNSGDDDTQQKGDAALPGTENNRPKGQIFSRRGTIGLYVFNPKYPKCQKLFMIHLVIKCCLTHHAIQHLLNLLGMDIHKFYCRNMNVFDYGCCSRSHWQFYVLYCIYTHSFSKIWIASFSTHLAQRNSDKGVWRYLLEYRMKGGRMADEARRGQGPDHTPSPMPSQDSGVSPRDFSRGSEAMGLNIQDYLQSTGAVRSMQTRVLHTTKEWIHILI